MNQTTAEASLKHEDDQRMNKGEDGQGREKVESSGNTADMGDGATHGGRNRDAFINQYGHGNSLE